MNTSNNKYKVGDLLIFNSDESMFMIIIEIESYIRTACFDYRHNGDTIEYCRYSDNALLDKYFHFLEDIDNGGNNG